VATIGVYGLVSCGVANRTNEIGIRIALGADKNRVIGMILKETGFMTAAGVCVGIAATAALTRTISTQLYASNRTVPRWSLAAYEHVESATHLFGVSALDPLTIALAITILSALALLAALIPAVRAAGVEPSRALRHE
jgi:ABC-type antimicrobial peptide transport system permease subunit